MAQQTYDMGHFWRSEDSFLGQVSPSTRKQQLFSSCGGCTGVSFVSLQSPSKAGILLFYYCVYMIHTCGHTCATIPGGQLGGVGSFLLL